MRRLTVSLITVLFTFLVGVCSAEHHFTRKGADETATPLPESRSTLKPAEPLLDPTIHQATLCELIRHPYAYDRKLIRLQTVYDNGIDGAGLVGTCDGKSVWLIIN